MMRKGVLFSFMALLLVLTLFSLIDALNSQRSSAKANASLSFAMQAANSKFENVFSDFILLDKGPAARLIDQRNLPFSYSTDYNSVSIVQELPLRQIVWNDYFDLVNAFKIFSEDSNYDAFFEGLDVKVQTVQNSVWGGTTQDLNFLLLPQCLHYNVPSALTSTGFYASSSSDCKAVFDASKIKKYVITVRVRKASFEDYNRITYNIAGFSNPSNPAFEFHFIDSNCTRCAVADSNKNLNGFFDPSQQSWIKIKCSGSGCKSQDINLFINQGMQAFHSGTYRIDVNFSLTFKNFIDSFYFTDFNASVQNKDFNLLYANR